MLSRPANGNIRPKLSSMPRQKSEAAAYLDMYKLAIEKKRLLQELQTMEQRRAQILQRLTVLESQLAAQENNVQQLREPTPNIQQNLTDKSQVAISPETSKSGIFDTLLLEY